MKAPAVATPSRALVILLVVAGLARADTTTLLRGLDTDDPQALSAAVTEIEKSPTTRELADVLFAAGRACEDRLLDPARALHLYERIVRELPDASVAIAAARRIETLRDVRGHEAEARAFALVVANADTWPAAVIVARTTSLAHAVPSAAPWLADWLCGKRIFDAAQALYARLPEGNRNAAGCAIDAGNFELARQLASTLPDANADAAIKRDLLAAAARGQTRARLYDVSWIALVVACIALLASLVEAIVRGGRRLPLLRPPIEVLFLAPLALVVLATTYATQRTIWPAVARISVVGLVLTWISGATLDTLRARGRSIRLRAIAHVIAVAAAVLAVGYIAVMRDGLMDMFVETLRYGPEH